MTVPSLFARPLSYFFPTCLMAFNLHTGAAPVLALSGHAGVCFRMHSHTQAVHMMHGGQSVIPTAVLNIAVRVQHLHWADPLDRDCGYR